MIYMQSPEIDQSQTHEQTQSEPVQERPDNIELSPAVQSTGATPTDDKFTNQVSDDDGNNLIQTNDDSGMPAITIPKTQQALQTQSRGDSSKGSTWNANFLLRFIKKALRLGIKVVYGNV
jgi:hypothetical protein